MENCFESAIFSSEKDKHLPCFLKQKYRLSALHPDISYAIINMKILRKCGGELGHSIKCRFVEPCSTEDCINSMEDIITRTRIVLIVSSNKDTHKEEFVNNKLMEAQIDPSLSPKMMHELVYVLYTYQNAFASDNEALATIKGHEVDINLNIDRPYPPGLRRPAYPASPRAREALEKHI
ncbi:hypothetical protein O181_020442 [Austropuccinia psidii MF-1]|uniref:Uncharacterized protein n=1 Tax=Austropuccinia psidii MF-1 TaxID=1389203 RepID=A0A9Q3CBN9_9BASI|nr:hypothetical protein [Austropuccinia psidii MF-1]